MQNSVDTIAHLLFRQPSLQEVSETALQAFVSDHPYSAVGHLLLTQHRKAAGKDYQEAARQAALYLQNPLWLQGFLQEMEAAPQYPGKHAGEALIQATEPQLPPEAAAAPAFPEPVAEQSHPTPSRTSDEISLQTTASNLAPLAFDPYHTIDYFASQGIKLSAEDFTKDKLGKQLKSFTDWLRTMKKVPPAATIVLPGDDQTETDAAILKTAAASVEVNEVETEAMAEVWVKQGKPARAAAIYRKLSLLNPSKSDYFAAKIEQLNA